MIVIFQWIFNILLIVVSIALIILVLAQQGKQAGLSGAIAGGAETFFGKKKARSIEGLLEKLTKICAVIFLVLALAMLLIQQVPVAPVV